MATWRWVGPAAAGLVLAAAGAFGQAAKTFDVATVKLSPPLDVQKLAAQMRAGQMPNFGAHLDGLRAEYNYMTMQQLLVYAYDVKPYQIVGPEWLTTEHYDIVARLPEGSTKNDAPAMLKALLADRFKLTAHMEDRDLAVYALVVGKDGPKLKDSPEPPPIDESAPLKPGETKMDLPDGPAIITGTPQAGQATVNMGTRGVFTEKINTQTQALAIDGKGVAMPGFVDMVNQIMQIGGPGSKLVVDHTGLKGHYEVALQLSLTDLIAAARRSGFDVPAGPGGAGGPGAASAEAEASDPGGGGGSTVTHSLEVLGLKLENAKAPVNQLIVDHAEKTPAEN
ncbi:MAG TPA: TIGR03435 family protein [Acidobacteriaceae bacterium]|nr:TIGR03435 family protein [Acidobacteriaceae bacterium]